MHDQLTKFLHSEPAAIFTTNYQDSEVRENVQRRILLSKSKMMGSQQLLQIEHKLKHYGFALVRYLDGIPTPDDMLQLAKSLKLGDPYVPQFISHLYENSGINYIPTSASPNFSQMNTDKLHFGFEDGGMKQDLHVDGTLLDIGFLQTSVLYCLSPAEEGGTSLWFNVLGAFWELAKEDYEAAVALLHPECVTLGVEGQTKVPSPVFKLQNEILETRFFLGYRDSWNHGLDKIPNLRRGFEKMIQFASVGSPYYLEGKLSAGEGIIMDNPRFCHGRSGYTNSATNRRVMLRGYFRNSCNFST